MGLNVKERGEYVATYRWICVRLMEMLSAWVPTTPEMEVKLLFGTHIWDMAQHADSFGKRTHELRLPLQHSRTPSEPYVDFLAYLASTRETDRRVAGFYDCLLPGLVKRFRAYLASVDSMLDGPTVRILERHLFDADRMLAEHRTLLGEVPAVKLVDQSWLEELRRREGALEGIIAPEAETPAAASA